MEHARKLRRGRETLPAKAIVPDDGARISFRDWERQVSPGILSSIVRTARRNSQRDYIGTVPNVKVCPSPSLLVEVLLTWVLSRRHVRVHRMQQSFRKRDAVAAKMESNLRAPSPLVPLDGAQTTSSGED